MEIAKNSISMSPIEFSVIDYLVFVALLIVSSAIGIYFGLESKQKDTTDDYLFGGRRMNPLPIAISLVASQLSGISIMSVPAEIYAFGFHYVWTMVDGVVVLAPLMAYLYVPIFYNCKVQNCYEAKMNATSESIQDSVSFHFGWEDHLFFTILLGVSAAIGVYFGFCGKGADTPDEYLLGGKKMKTIPIAISLVASQLSGISVMSIPAEMFSFGITYSLIVPAMFVVLPIMCYIIIPVFYNNNISNCYEYLEMRFDKRVRQVVTIAFLVTVYLIIPVIIFIPALAFAQVTGINIHLINGVVCCVCVFYTMLGGIKAVVWTDVVQATIMLFSVVLVASMGVYRVGGFGEVINRAWEGGRLNAFDMTLDLTTRATFWNCFLGGIFLWSGYVGLNQSCVQRIVALPSLSHARKSLVLFAIGFFIIMTCNCFTGVVMYARYYDCDPVKAGIVEKPDKLMPFFVQDIVGHLKGMPGVFISCVFSAALSTMSANLNSLAGIVYFDYIKPHIRHTETRANFIMKILVVLTGLYCILGGLIVEKFTSILQMVITIAGITQGAVVGVFMLGMLYPKASSKGALWGTIFSMVALAWIITGSQVAIREGKVKYDFLPSSIDQCEAHNVTVLEKAVTFINQTIAASTQDEPFSIYKISFNWYAVLGAAFVWLLGVPLSYILPEDEDKKFDADLISPVAQYFIPKEFRRTRIPQHDDIKEPVEMKVFSKT